MSDHTNYSGYECAGCGLPLPEPVTTAPCTCGSRKFVASLPEED